MPFACIFVPDFPVEAILRAEPELRSQALAVLEGKAPLQTVFAVNENARRAGVSPRMTKLQVEACPDLVLRARSLSQEDAAHAAQRAGELEQDADRSVQIRRSVLLPESGRQPLSSPAHMVIGA